MLQFFRNISKLFSPQPHPDKSTTPMSKPHVRIPHIVQSTPSSSTPDELLAILADNRDADPHRDQTLRDCLVDEVGHYRSSTGGKGAHEVIVVRFHHQTTDDNGMVYTDRRAAKLERLKQDRQSECTGYAPPGSVQLMDVTREELKETTTQNRDRISFVEDPSCWLSYSRHKYELVASFTPAPGTLNIVDCAAAAHVLTQRAVYYTTLQFMCMWYARILFETLRRLAGSPAVQDGPAIRDAGKFGMFRMINKEGRLKLREPERTLDQAASQVVTLLHLRVPPTSDSGDGDSSEDMLDAFLHEFQDARGSTTIEPLREVEAQVRTVRDHQWDIIRQAAKVARDACDRLNAAERLQRENDLLRAQRDAESSRYELLRARSAAERQELFRLRAQLAKYNGN